MLTSMPLHLHVLFLLLLMYSICTLFLSEPLPIHRRIVIICYVSIIPLLNPQALNPPQRPRTSMSPRAHSSSPLRSQSPRAPSNSQSPRARIPSPRACTQSPRAPLPTPPQSPRAPSASQDAQVFQQSDTPCDSKILQVVTNTAAASLDPPDPITSEVPEHLQ